MGKEAHLSQDHRRKIRESYSCPFLDTVLFVKGISFLGQGMCNGVERKSTDQACASIPCRAGVSRPSRCAGAPRALTPQHLHGQKNVRLIADKKMCVASKIMLLMRLRGCCLPWSLWHILRIKILLVVATAKARCNNLRAAAQRATFAGLPAARSRS